MPDSDVLSRLPARSGHFVLESGYHSDLWFTLDDLFYDPAAVAPLIEALAEKLRPHRVRVVCGPLMGGSFLAQGLATNLGARFCYTEPVGTPESPGLFAAEYRLPFALHSHVEGERVAIVDDVISAGSSVRATIACLSAAGASPVVIGALVVLGERALSHFASENIPVETLERRTFDVWTPGDCPWCRSGKPLEDPRRTELAGD